MEAAILRSDKELNHILQRAQSQNIVAIDTEFVWEKTYYPNLGIIQIGFSQDESYIIDVLTCRDLSPIGNIISDPNIIKILHDANQDLTILRQATNAYPQNVFDTRCVAGFVGLSSSISLRELLHKTHDINLSKTQTRTNWLKRPLTHKQIEYALDDVRYLPSIREWLLYKAKKFDRLSWIDEELNHYNDPDLYQDVQLETVYQKIKGQGRLSSAKRAVLSRLAIWREKTAIQENRPRSHIVSDDIMIQLSESHPNTLSELQSNNRIPRFLVSKYGSTILEQILTGLNDPPLELKLHQETLQKKDILNSQVDLCLAYLKSKCFSNKIDAALVASRADLTSFIAELSNQNHHSHFLLNGWRKDFIGNDFLKIFTNQGLLQVNYETGVIELQS